MIYYVIELQSSTTGAAIPFAYTELQDAEAKYHPILAAAAKSAVPKHGAMIITDRCLVIKSEVYEHEPPAAAEPAEETEN